MNSQLPISYPNALATPDAAPKAGEAQMHILLNLDVFARVVGRNIAARRQLLGITQQRLADAATYSREHISTIETGRVLPTLSCLYAIAAALGVSPRDLL